MEELNRKGQREVVDIKQQLLSVYLVVSRLSTAHTDINLGRGQNRPRLVPH